MSIATLRRKYLQSQADKIQREMQEIKAEENKKQAVQIEKEHQFQKLVREWEHNCQYFGIDRTPSNRWKFMMSLAMRSPSPDAFFLEHGKKFHLQEFFDWLDANCSPGVKKPERPKEEK